MPSRTNFISFRIAEELHAELKKRAGKMGQSPGGLARKIVLESLASGEATIDGMLELKAEVQSLRADLATATEALLTVMGGTTESGNRAAAWVKRNLNLQSR